MIGKFAQQFSTGIKQGFRTRDFAFLGILVIGLGTPPLILAMMAAYTGQPLSWHMIREAAVPLFFSVVFCLYMVTIKALQVFHQQAGNPDTAPQLVKQFDAVVFVVLIVLIASFMLK